MGDHFAGGAPNRRLVVFSSSAKGPGKTGNSADIAGGMQAGSAESQQNEGSQFLFTREKYTENYQNTGWYPG
jgi:hypothetical protein